jgi:hypothetical protein
MKVSSLIVGAVLFVGGLTACPTSPPIDPNAISSIEVSPTSLSLEVGQTASGLSAVAKNASGNVISGAAFTWTSSDPSVMTVDSSSGKVTALKGGTAQLKASSAGVSGAAGINISFTLRLEAYAYADSPMTIFVSKADGSLITSQTVTPAERNKRIVVSDVPGDAIVTSAYKMRRPEYTCNVSPCGYIMMDIVRLQSYSATYVNERTFSFGNSFWYGNIQAVLAKPNIANVTRANGIYPYFGSNADFGANSTVVFYDSLYGSKIQSDGKFSPLFFARDNNNNPLAYAAILDRAVSGTGNDVINIAAADWKTDLSSLALTISNYDGYTYTGGKTSYNGCFSVLGVRKNVFMNGNDTCPVYNNTNSTLTTNLKYPPNYYDSLGYNIFIGTGNTTLAGRPITTSSLTVRDLNSLPSSLTLNAQTDFLKSPTNFVLTDTNTAQPKASWVKSSNLASSGDKGTTLSIDISQGLTNQNYNWYFINFSEDQTSLIVPQLPSNLGSDFSPADTTTFKHRYTISNYENNVMQGNYRQSSSQLTPSYVPAVAGATLGTQSATQPYNPETSDPYAIILK